MSEAASRGLDRQGPAGDQAREIDELREEVARLRAILGRRSKARPGMTIKEVMVLIGATAIGLSFVAGHFGEFPRIYSGGGTRFQPVSTACNAYVWAGPVVQMWMLATLLLRLRRPRPRLVQLGRQPGVAACAVAAVAYLAAWVALILSSGGFGGSGFSYDSDIIVATLPVGYAVGGSWMTLAFSGRCRPDPGWPDRAGRAFAAYWLGTIPACWLAFYLN